MSSNLFFILLFVVLSSISAQHEAERELETSSWGGGRSKQKIVIPRFGVDELILANDANSKPNNGGDIGPHQIARIKDVYIVPPKNWQKTPDGKTLWEVEISAPGANLLGLGFSPFRLPDGAIVTVVATDGSSSLRPLTSSDNNPNDDMWTPHLPTDSVTVTVTLPRGVPREEVKLIIESVFADFRPKSGPGSCNIDVVCPQGASWEDEIRSVVRIEIPTSGGVGSCTGALINNLRYDETPYVLTASHCSITPQSAAASTFTFNFENTRCGQSFHTVTPTQFLYGATVVAEYPDSDMLLLLLNQSPPENYCVAYSGWDRTGTTPEGAVSIHHPGGYEKKISFDYDRLSIDSYTGNTCQTHWVVNEWDEGTTEGGSSGGPLYDFNRRIIGQLHGGSASCSNPTGQDLYGRFSVSWNGNFSPSGSLRPWLDPDGTFLFSVDTLVASCLIFPTTGPPVYFTPSPNFSPPFPTFTPPVPTFSPPPVANPPFPTFTPPIPTVPPPSIVNPPFPTFTPPAPVSQPMTPSPQTMSPNNNNNPQPSTIPVVLNDVTVIVSVVGLNANQFALQTAQYLLTALTIDIVDDIIITVNSVFGARRSLSKAKSLDDTAEALAIDDSMAHRKRELHHDYSGTRVLIDLSLIARLSGTVTLELYSQLLAEIATALSDYDAYGESLQSNAHVADHILVLDVDVEEDNNDHHGGYYGVYFGKKEVYYNNDPYGNRSPSKTGKKDKSSSSTVKVTHAFDFND